MATQLTEHDLEQPLGEARLARRMAVQTAILAVWLGGGMVTAAPITLFGTGVDDLGSENLLDFVLVNSGTSANPTGLFVDIGGTVTNIPEPAALSLALAALIGMVALGAVGLALQE